MNRTAWLQDRRMAKFRDVLSRWERKELSAQEAGEILGMSERQFRRYRRRYEEDGVAGLADRRLGKASAKRVPVDKITWMLGQYRTQHMGWNVKHFHEHIQRQYGFEWGYTWTKTQLHTAAKFICRSITTSSRCRRRSMKAPSWRSIPQASSISCASSTTASSRVTTRSPMRAARSSSRKARHAPTTSRPTSRCGSIPTALSRCSTARGASHATARRGTRSSRSQPP